MSTAEMEKSRKKSGKIRKNPEKSRKMGKKKRDLQRATDL